MRVIAGSARSIPLIAPKGDNTRPTTDRIKETLFNCLQCDIPDSVFIDLFSGSGAIGIEALSRGAIKAYFVDNDKESIACIETNLKKTKLINQSVVIKQDAITAITYSIHEPIDIIFADPPYNNGFPRMILEGIKDSDFVTNDTLIVIEEALNADFSFANECGFSIVKEKNYKNNKHIFLRRS